MYACFYIIFMLYEMDIALVTSNFEHLVFFQLSVFNYLFLNWTSLKVIRKVLQSIAPKIKFTNPVRLFLFMNLTTCLYFSGNNNCLIQSVGNIYLSFIIIENLTFGTVQVFHVMGDDTRLPLRSFLDLHKARNSQETPLSG
jgi:hypothetical protein